MYQQMNPLQQREFNRKLKPRKIRLDQIRIWHGLIIWKFVEKNLKHEFNLWFFYFYYSCLFDLLITWLEYSYFRGSKCNAIESDTAKTTICFLFSVVIKLITLSLNNLELIGFHGYKRVYTHFLPFISKGWILANFFFSVGVFLSAVGVPPNIRFPAMPDQHHNPRPGPDPLRTARNPRPNRNPINPSGNLLLRLPVQNPAQVHLHQNVLLDRLSGVHPPSNHLGHGLLFPVSTPDIPGSKSDQFRNLPDFADGAIVAGGCLLLSGETGSVGVADDSERV